MPIFTGCVNYGRTTKIASRWRVILNHSLLSTKSPLFVETPTLSSSRSPLWRGNARTKPASTEQLRNSPSIASVFASGVNATAHWNDKPAECLENAAVYALANLRQSSSSFWRTREAKVDRCRTSFCRRGFSRFRFVLRLHNEGCIIMRDARY